MNSNSEKPVPFVGSGEDVSWPIVNAAIELCAFVKTHEYPKEMSEDFIELTHLFDKLETELRAAKIIPRGKWPS